MAQPNQSSIRYCWEADKVKTLIRLRAELSPLFTGKRNASKYAWAVVERELNVPLPISKIIKKWNNLLQEYKAIKLSEEPKRREWPFFNLMDVYFSDQVNDPSLRLFSSTKRFDTDTFDDKNFDEELAAVLAAANINTSMSSVLTNLSLGMGFNRMKNHQPEVKEIKDDKNDEDEDAASEVSINLSTKMLGMNSIHNSPKADKNNNNKSNLQSLNNASSKASMEHEKLLAGLKEQNNNSMANNRNLIGAAANNNHSNTVTYNSDGVSLSSSRQSANSHVNSAAEVDEYEDNMVRAYERNLKNLNQKFLHEMNEHHNIDQYLLSWRGFHGNMCKGFHNLQRDGQMVDVTIAAGGKIFKAHKLVLSVCSPYFQKIFIDHPSSHPILFMTDVNSSHMAGLLDFMYSGQVNVKYEDLPNFLKVAEALQVKGLHGESTTDNAEEREREREREENSYASQYRQQQQQQALHIQQQQQQQQQQQAQQQQQQQQPPQFNYPGHINRQPTPSHFVQDNNFNEQRAGIRHHIKPKTSLMSNPDTTSMTLNNNNNVNMTNNNHKNVKFPNIQQVNTSAKMLNDNHKFKYFSKRKMVHQYEQEMRQEKRMRDSVEDDDGERPLNMRRSDSTTGDDARTPDNGECVGLNLIQNIKRERGDEDHPMDVNGNDEVGPETIAFYGSHMDKIKHSILEPNIVLQHSDEVLTPTNGSKSLASSLQNSNLIQNTSS